VRRALLVLLLAGAALWAAPGALAAGWCGTDVSATDRPDVVTGQQVHAIWAIPSDGTDTFATGAAKIADDVTSLTAWWAGQDPTRVPRLDQATFTTGTCLDISSVKLPDPGSTFAGDAGTDFDRLANDLASAGFDNPYKRYLVYYDGPAVDATTCGVGGGSFDSGPAFAFVFTHDCLGPPAVFTDSVATHELLHALGALPTGAPNACTPATNPVGPVADAAHPCDSTTDVLYPLNSGTPLAQQVLDYGHDDYYAHPGTWIDVQDSLWLHRLDQPQFPLAVAMSGSGSVTSDLPGLACPAACTTQWDQGETPTLVPTPARGSRFVGWKGACSGLGYCQLILDAAKQVTAVFGPVAVPVKVSTAGKGKVTCKPACSKGFHAGNPLTLRAVAAKGWRFVRWSGGCAGTRPVCSPKTDFALSVRATFRRR
jgi:hypothetical protein